MITERNSSEWFTGVRGKDQETGTTVDVPRIEVRTQTFTDKRRNLYVVMCLHDLSIRPGRTESDTYPFTPTSHTVRRSVRGWSSRKKVGTYWISLRDHLESHEDLGVVLTCHPSHTKDPCRRIKVSWTSHSFTYRLSLLNDYDPNVPITIGHT